MWNTGDTGTAGALLLATVLAAAGTGCGSDGPRSPLAPPPPPPPPAEPAEITATTPTDQEATVADELRVGVLVRAAHGAPLQGVEVTFSVTAGGGEVTSTATTGSEGTASAMWQLGTQVGENLLEATAASLEPIGFRSTTVAGPPATVVPIHGNGQTGPAGASLPYAVMVGAADAYGNPTPAATVKFEVMAGGGFAAALDPAHVGGGLAGALWRLGEAPGENRLLAHVAGMAEGVELVATGLAVATAFDVHVRFEDPAAFVPGHLAAMEAAVAKVRSVLAASPQAIVTRTPAFECKGIPNVRIPSLDEVISNPIVFAAVRRFGTDPGYEQFGSVAGLATVCIFRFFAQDPGIRTAMLGAVVLNGAHLENTSPLGLLATEQTMTHELLHAMGLGTIWGPDPELGWPDLIQGRDGPDPRFLGPAAIAAYGGTPNNREGIVPIPLENQGAVTASLSHWRTSIFLSEMMTSTPILGLSPVSSVTLGALADIGYVTNAERADPFVLPGNPGVVRTREGTGRFPDPVRALRTMAPGQSLDHTALPPVGRRMMVDATTGRVRWIDR